MTEKILNYFSMLLLLKQGPYSHLEISVDHDIEGLLFMEFVNEDGDTEIKWTKADAQANLSCGPVLFNDFVEVDYWLNNCADELVPEGDYKSWAQDLDGRNIVVRNTMDQTFSLTANDVAKVISKSHRKLFSVDELREIHLEVNRLITI
ncbi:hypothetical protein ACP6H6_12955 [Vibrio harveyi]